MAISSFMGGFECSTHRRGDGLRLDVIAATRHDRYAAQDYRILYDHGLTTIRDGVRWHLIESARGQYDWTSLDPMIDAAAAAGVSVIWDMLHYGWPDWTDPWQPDFAARFANFAHATASRIGPAGYYVAINEISFLSWAGGEVAYMNPFTLGRGNELKQRLCAAAIAATGAIRAADHDATMVGAEPLIHVHGAEPGSTAGDGFNAAQFDAVDALLGRTWPELGGDDSLIDIVGLNYYPQNQFTIDRQTVERDDVRYRPLRTLLRAAAGHFGMPLIIAETGCEDDERQDWLHYIANEVRAANADGAGVDGICLYPILDHPGWDDDRHCHNGLFCGYDPARPSDPSLAEELARQQRLGLSNTGGNVDHPLPVQATAANQSLLCR